MISQAGSNPTQLEVTSIQDYTFNEQFANYQRSGYAVDSSTNQIIGDRDMYKKEKILTGKDEKSRSSSSSSKSANKKRKLLSLLDQYGADSDEDDTGGPWAAEKGKQELLADPPTGANREIDDTVPDEGDQGGTSGLDASNSSAATGVYILEPDEEDEKWEKVNERKQSYTLPPRPQRGSQVAEASSVFHGKALKDYQGRPWCVAPSDLKPEEEGTSHNCYIPKRCIKKLTGHTKGVQALEYFPGTGHLLLSASMDGKCKIWDSHTSEMQVQRTYIGHSEGVRSIHMSNTGHHFLSSGFDRLIRYWDVETGQAVGTFSNRKMAYSVRFYPRDNNIFIAACNDNKLYQWDARTGEICQEYNHHLQACNTVTFIDEGRKFVSTSDDKKILVWEFDIPVPIKYIADPGMHCIPSVSVHPSHQCFAAQSMDNTIVVYTCGEKVRPLKKKTFRGHNNSGYACQIGFSPNGRFLASGDGLGQLHFWDWKSTKCYRKFHAHDHGPCMAAAWHPLFPSRVATCGWDSLIKIWD
mmetsp:Transcript_21910/g.36681  ORF Transcript_21910/g.36681 Transcript_21910/m.36681 type:complete len:525 (+) Transcript_21910:56-1630(+)